MQSFRRAWDAFSGNQTSQPDNNTTTNTTATATTTGTSSTDNDSNNTMDDPLSMLANQSQQKRQSNNALINEMDDLENRVIPYTINSNGNGKNKNNKNKKPNQNMTQQNGSTINNGSQNSYNHFSKKHYRSISHNTTGVSPAINSFSAFSQYTNQQRKSS